MGEKKSKKAVTEDNPLEKTTSSRSLKVTEKIKADFNEVRKFGNFNKMVFHKYFHFPS